MQFGQVGQFFKGLATNFVTKVSQVFGDLLVYFEKRHYIVKNCCGYYLGNFCTKLGDFFPQIWSHCAYANSISSPS